MVGAVICAARMCTEKFAKNDRLANFCVHAQQGVLDADNL
jgi:hypothetical protein